MVFNNMLEGKDTVETFWTKLPQDDIYRLVLDFGLCCYRVEDDQFRMICAGELNPGDADCIIREMAEWLAKEDRERFLSTFAVDRLSTACAIRQRIIKMACTKSRKQGELRHIRARIGGVPQDMCVEFCFEV